MNGFDYAALSAIAQLGLGLAGFSGIGLVLRAGAGGGAGPLQRVQLYRLGVMLGTAFGVMLGALVPIVVAQFAADPERVCRVSAGILALMQAGLAINFRIAVRYFQRTVPEIVSRVASRLVFVVHIVNTLVQASSALGLLDNCVGWYWLGLMWLLVAGTYQFGRILFVRPRDENSA